MLLRSFGNVEDNVGNEEGKEDAVVQNVSQTHPYSKITSCITHGRGKMN